jgi:hypothetical protein
MDGQTSAIFGTAVFGLTVFGEVLSQTGGLPLFRGPNKANPWTRRPATTPTVWTRRV